MITKVINFGTKVYNGYSLVTSLIESGIRFVVVAILIASAWFLSAWSHEHDMIRACDNNQTYDMFVSGKEIIDCKIQDKVSK